MLFYCSVKDLRCRTNSPARRKNGWNRKNIRKRTLRHMFRLLKYEWRNREMRWRKIRKIRKLRRCCRQMKTCRGRNISARVRVLFRNRNRFLP